MTAWERRLDMPLTVAAVLFLVAYGVPIIWTDLPSPLLDVFVIVANAVWVLFAADYVVRLVLANDRWRFVRRNLLDLAVIALPLLRQLRLLRLVTMLKFLDRRATSQLRGRVITYVIGGAGLLSLVGALAVLDAEREDPAANIRTFGDALWWAFETMSTVGYGDFYPITFTGRVVAVGLMIGGIGILGTVTATLASWMVERIREEAKP